MKQLTESQKEFILTNFFTNDRYAGWKSIGEKLLDKGKCIVSGTECIWIGGIGNFINVTPAEDAVGCSDYTFDLDDFLKSAWFNEVKTNHVHDMSLKLLDLQTKYEDLCELS
jgi:hypothetical protein